MEHGVVRRGWIATWCALLGASLLVVRSSTASGAGIEPGASVEQQPASCGTPGQAPCPMQAWMRTSVATPLASNDAAALAAALDRTARLTPDASWTSWSTFAANGAAAARQGDLATTRASCKGCHEAWREKYRAGYRTRPLPR